MNCPIEGCDNPVEPGPNARIKVSKGQQSRQKLVCTDCYDMFMGYLCTSH